MFQVKYHFEPMLLISNQQSLLCNRLKYDVKQEYCNVWCPPYYWHTLSYISDVTGVKIDDIILLYFCQNLNKGYSVFLLILLQLLNLQGEGGNFRSICHSRDVFPIYNCRGTDVHYLILLTPLIQNTFKHV